MSVPVSVHQPAPDRTLAVWLDSTPDLSSTNSTQADCMDGEHQPTDLVVGVRIPRGARKLSSQAIKQGKLDGSRWSCRLLEGGAQAAPVSRSLGLEPGRRSRGSGPVGFPWSPGQATQPPPVRISWTGSGPSGWPVRLASTWTAGGSAGAASAASEVVGTSRSMTVASTA